MTDKNSPVTDWSTVTVTSDVIALFFGDISTTLVERWAREDAMPKQGPGAYPLLACVQWRLNRQRESRPATVESARQRELTAKAIKLETWNLVRAGELIELGTVASVMDQVMAVLGTTLDSLGPRLAGTLAIETDPARILKVILDETRDMRRSASAQIKALGRAVADGRDTPPAAEPKRGRVGRRAPNTSPRKSRTRTVAN